MILQNNNTKKYFDINNCYIYSIFLIIALLIYHKSLCYEFNWDDFTLFKENTTLYNKTLFTSLKSYFSQSTFGWYRPFYLLSFYISYNIHHFNPFLLRTENLIIFCLICIFIYKIIFNLTQYKKLSFFTVAIYSALPINTEILCFISARDSSLVLLFSLISIYNFHKYLTSKHSLTHLFLSNIFLLLSLLTKENGICTLGWIASIAYFFKNKPLIKSHLFSYIMTSSIYFYLRINAEITNIAQPLIFLEGNGLIQLITIPSLILKYISIILFPLELNIYYNFPEHAFELTNLFLVGLSIIIISKITLNYVKNSILKFAITTFYISLLPFMHIISIHNYITNRWANMAAISLTIIIVFTLIKLIQNKQIHHTILLLIITVYGFTSYNQTKIWENDITLFEYAVKKDPNFKTGLYNLGNLYFNENKFIEAEQYYKKCIELDNRHQPSLTNLGFLYLRLKNHSKAKFYFQESLTISDNNYAKDGMKILEERK